MSTNDFDVLVTDLDGDNFVLLVNYYVYYFGFVGVSGVVVVLLFLVGWGGVVDFVVWFVDF